MNKKLSQIALQLGNEVEKQGRTSLDYSNLQSDYTSQQSKLRDIELEYGKLEAFFQSQSEQLLSQGDAAQKLQTLLEESNAKQHSAERENHAFKTELTENKIQQQDLLSRLNSAVDHLGLERESLLKEKELGAQLDKHAKGEEVKAQQIDIKYQEQNQQLRRIQEQYDALQVQFASVSSEYTELKTSLSEREKNHQQQLDQFGEQKATLKKEFENLANKIFEEKGRSFTDTSSASIEILLKPFREQIDGFQSRINAIHDESLKGNTTLNAEIKKVLEVGLKMGDDASNLTSALKGNSQQRGAWGEAQLKRTLEMSGLIEDAHYEAQSSFKDLAGKQKQTDYLIKLPDEKHIIIDSKVSLLAYDKSVSATNEEVQNLAMSEHVKAVKSHIDDLASKDYTNLVGMRSPSFVLMFMPIE
ncbi:MAG: DNA recombination protein RmuC, partial [Gammaproteobacteria bacterium]|nr:DNA recombination protein RmuC [Gammaproteobacteria bacterium]